MAENTKMPPNQDQRQRMPQGDASKPGQKPGQKPGSVGTGNPNKPGSEIDPDRNRTDRGRQPPAPEKDPATVDDIDEDEDLGTEKDEELDQTQRQDRGDRK